MNVFGMPRVTPPNDAMPEQRPLVEPGAPQFGSPSE